MDNRSRSFSMLGLSETATKEQIKAAYERKAAKYKGPDYAEERAYAERKLTQLYQAYQEAYEAAESGPSTRSTSRIERDVEPITKEKQKKTTRLLDAERDASEHNNREKFHQWMERRDDDRHERKTRRTGKMELPKLSKPDFSKLREKLDEIKEEVATQLELHSDDEDGTGYEMEPLAVEPEFEKADFSEPAGKYINAEAEMPEDEPASEKIYTEDSSEAKDGKLEVVKLIISVIIIIVTAVGGCGDDSIDDMDYEETGCEYIFDLASEDILDEDREIASLADESYILLLNQDERDFSSYTYEIEKEDEEKANQFAKNYWGKESIQAVLDDLDEKYGDYLDFESETLGIQLDEIFKFYGFADLDTACMYERPYTGGQIESYGDYLEYLNRFYEAQ